MEATRRSGRGGFTLIELMVAMVLTTIILAAVYNMFITSSAIFHTQEDLAAAEYQLESAMDRVMSDLQRAGFGSTPNSDLDPLFCPGGGIRIQGIVVDAGAGKEQILHTDLNTFIYPDNLSITGNFSTSSTIPGLASSNRVTLQVAEQAGANPYDPAAHVMTRSEFAAIFTDQIGRLVAVRNSYGKVMIQPLTAANYPDLTFSDLSGSGGVNCGVRGSAAPVEINPVDTVRYRILRSNPLVPKDASTQLIREFLGPDGNPLNVSQMVVAENAVDLHVWFMFRSNDPTTNAILPPAHPERCESNQNIPVNGSAGARPDLIRSAVVRLATRTEMEHGEIRHWPRQGESDRLTTFDTDGNSADGVAPVVVLTGEVEVPNFSLRELAAR